jgi:amidase
MIELFPNPPVFNLGKSMQPLATVKPGDQCIFHTSDEGYRLALADGLDADPSTIQRLNALTGPVFVEDAHAGEILEIVIEDIEVGDVAYAVYVDRWGIESFGMRGSWIHKFDIFNNQIVIDGNDVIQVRPMIGCAGVAPTSNSLSSLSPTSIHGGNMDVRQLEKGSHLLLPIAIDGALFALGDLHAAMGEGEAAGAGFECAGKVTVQFRIRTDLKLDGPRIETSDEIIFLGVDARELWTARHHAIRSAWKFLRDECRIEDKHAFAVVSGLLDLKFGGPAGANVLASFRRLDLDRAGVNLSDA